MKFMRVGLLMSLCALGLTMGVAGAEMELTRAVECHTRDGLPNFFAKVVKPGAEVKIAYLGGSITAQPGWRVKTLERFQKTYPEAKISEIHAAIGGTGSDLGVCRLKQDVLDHKPDLLFVEFAVNDGGTAPEQIFRCMEGIVRQTWRALPECDICFVYTLTEALAPAMLEGKFQRSASAMERVAGHYGIPTIHMAMAVAELAKEGKLIWKAALPKTEAEHAALGGKMVFAPDGVHPHVETGHVLYTAAVVRSFGAIQVESKAPGAHVLGEPFEATHYERAKMVPISEVTLSGGFEALDMKEDAFGKRWAKRMKGMYQGSAEGETIRFKFKGTRCAVYDVVGPDCGQVTVSLDGGEARVVPRFDSYCTSHRLSSFLIGTELEDKVHEVVITIDPGMPDKVKILAQREQKMDKEERFAGKNFFPGALLLVGDLVKE
ncbi:MAG: SGNH/GDSL hydrolase family protein [Verrucomicrobiaceae bacterium]|nr:SGNH/GDSL hydrolase family protein [Verrucomicrobiaceae bacterium]